MNNNCNYTLNSKPQIVLVQKRRQTVNVVLVVGIFQ